MLKNSLYSVLDLLPGNRKCFVENIKIKNSLIIDTNSDEEDDRNTYCLDRFIDISDKIDRVQCDFDDHLL